MVLFNAISDTNHNNNPTNPNRYSTGNPNPTNPTNPTNPNTRYREFETPFTGLHEIANIRLRSLIKRSLFNHRGQNRIGKTNCFFSETHKQKHLQNTQSIRSRNGLTLTYQVATVLLRGQQKLLGLKTTDAAM